MAQPDLATILEAHRAERHAVVLQAFPDPDAISSAFAHRLISARFDIETTLLYSGKISHQQNVALVKLLGIDLIRDRSTSSPSPGQCSWTIRARPLKKSSARSKRPACRPSSSWITTSRKNG